MTSTVTNAEYRLVHANVAIAKAPLDDPRMSGFMDRVDEIDTLAQGWPGFIAQPTLPDEGAIYSEPALLNVSIWDSVENLRAFTYTGQHADQLERRADWFEQPDEPTYVLYWSPAGEIPTEAQINERFDYLNQHGPTPYAFTFGQSYLVEEMLEYSGTGTSSGES
jgi:hypothetical protein